MYSHVSVILPQIQRTYSEKWVKGSILFLLTASSTWWVNTNEVQKDLSLGERYYVALTDSSSKNPTMKPEMLCIPDASQPGSVSERPRVVIVR